MLKLALIENLRRLAEETLEGRAARLAGRSLPRPDRGAHGAAGRAAPGSSTRLRGPAAAAHARVRRPVSPVRAEARGAPRRPGHDGRGRDPRRASAPGDGPGLDGQLHHQPAPVRHARLDAVRRERQPGRAGAAARPGRASTAAWTSRAATATATRSRSWPSRPARRRCASRCAASRARARSAERQSADDRAAHVGYHLIGRGRRDLEIDVSYQPGVAGRARRFVFAPRHRCLPRLDRAAHRGAACARRGRTRAGWRRPLVAGGRRAARCCSRRPSSPSRSCSASWPPVAAAAAAAARPARAACPRRRGRW